MRILYIVLNPIINTSVDTDTRQAPSLLHWWDVVPSWTFLCHIQTFHRVQSWLAIISTNHKQLTVNCSSCNISGFSWKTLKHNIMEFKTIQNLLVKDQLIYSSIFNTKYNNPRNQEKHLKFIIYIITHFIRSNATTLTGSSLQVSVLGSKHSTVSTRFWLEPNPPRTTSTSFGPTEKNNKE